MLDIKKYVESFRYILIKVYAYCVPSLSISAKGQMDQTFAFSKMALTTIHKIFVIMILLLLLLISRQMGKVPRH